MSIMMIATLVEKGKTAGVRLIDTEAIERNKASYKDVPVQSIISALTAEPNAIINLGLLNGELVGTNGVLDRYAKISINSRMLIGNSPMVVLNSIGDVGYTICDYDGNVRKWSNADTFKYANMENCGIANGKAVEKDGIQFISSIVGTYDTVAVPKAKAGANSGATAGIFISVGGSPDSRSVAKHARMDVDREVRETDVFKTMTPQQKKVIQAYYVWYTVDIFKDLAKGLRLNVPEDKVETMAELRGEREWRFGGVTDLGFLGAGYCELGHALRYAYRAYPMMKDGKFGEPIIFGETCSSDFFNISPEDMRHLVKARTIMSDEIKIMSEISANDLHGLFFKKTPLLNEWLEETPAAEVMRILGQKVGGTLLAFKICGMPYPESLVKTVSIELEKNYLAVLNKLYPNNKQERLSDILDPKMFYSTDLNTLVGRYCKFMLYVKFRGDYGYDPIANTGKEQGLGFNAKTREARTYLLRNMKTYLKAEQFNLREFKDVLMIRDRFDSIKEILEKHIEGKYDRTNIVTQGLESVIRGTYEGVTGYVDEATMALGLLNYYKRQGFEAFRRILNVKNDMYFKIWLRDVAAILERVGDSDDNIDYIVKKMLEDKAEKERLEEQERQRRIDEEIAEQKRKEQERIDAALKKKAEEDRIAAEAAEEKRKEQERIDTELKKKAAELKAAETEKENAGLSLFDEMVDTGEFGTPDPYAGIPGMLPKGTDKPSGNKMVRLADLLNKYAGDANVIKDYGCDIARDILKKGLEYTALSSKQKYRIDKTLEDLERAENGESLYDIFHGTGGTAKPANVTNNDAVEKATRVLDITDVGLLKEIEEASSIAISVARTVLKQGTASDKQMKHLDTAIAVIEASDNF